MTGRDRRRRVVLLCCSFARNLAYYRARQDGRLRELLSASHPQASFWRQVNANFLDICVLEWCKLLGDRAGEHYWSRVASDVARFEAGLLQHVRMDADAFQAEIRAMRHYRDKFVAHLDDLPVMDIPVLETAKEAVWFYHCYVVTFEVQAGDLAGIPADTTERLSRGYEQCLEEAAAIYAVARGRARL